jgi:hypothetical protein
MAKYCWSRALLGQNACTKAILASQVFRALNKALYSANEPTRTCLVSKCQELGSSLTVVTSLIYSLLPNGRVWWLLQPRMFTERYHHFGCSKWILMPICAYIHIYSRRYLLWLSWSKCHSTATQYKPPTRLLPLVQINMHCLALIKEHITPACFYWIYI